MASQTRPLLMTGAALASAATLVVATPAIAPTLNQAAVAVANGDYNLATFSDIFTIPTSEWTDVLFGTNGGYGGFVGPNNPLPLEPWASACNGTCHVSGLSGVGYLALDALINGDGTGWENSANWSVGAVNYFFEGGVPFGLGGLGAGVEYILQESIGSTNQVLSILITVLFAGTQIVSVAYIDAIGLLADAALSLPILGDYVYGALNAYLGPDSQNPDYHGYFPGPSGVLNYVVDVLINNAPPPPAAAELEVADAVPAAAAAALVSEVAAPMAATDASVESEASVPAADDPAGTPAGAVEAETETASTGSSDAEASAGAEAEEAGPASTSDVATDVAADADAEAVTAESAEADASPAADAGTGVVANPRETVADARSEAQASDNPVKSRKRPIRDAVEKVGNAIGSALKGSKSKASATAGATAGGDGAESSS